MPQITTQQTCDINRHSNESQRNHGTSANGTVCTSSRIYSRIYSRNINNAAGMIGTSIENERKAAAIT